MGRFLQQVERMAADLRASRVARLRDVARIRQETRALVWGAQEDIRRTCEAARRARLDRLGRVRAECDRIVRAGGRGRRQAARRLRAERLAFVGRLRSDVGASLRESQRPLREFAADLRAGARLLRGAGSARRPEPANDDAETKTALRRRGLRARKGS